MWREFAVLFAGFVLMASWLAGEDKLGARGRASGTFSAGGLLVINVGEVASSPGHGWVLLATGVMLAIGVPAAAYRLWPINGRRRSGGIGSLMALDKNSRGGQLLTQFDRTGDTATLAAGIEAFREAVAATVGRPQHQLYVANLIQTLVCRCERLGDVADLNEAITISEPLRRAAEAGAELVPIMSALRLRYEHQGELADLDEAIMLGQRLLGGHPGRGLHRAAVAEALSLTFDLRYLGTDTRADLLRAIEFREQALAATPWDRRRRGLQHVNLCRLRTMAADDSRRLLDIDSAITDGRRAVELLPRRDRQHPKARHNLARALLKRYHRRKDLADLDEAIKHAQLATARTDDDDPNLAQHRWVLAKARYERYRHSKQPGELRAALDTARAAATELRLPISQRIALGLTWADIAAEAGEKAEAVRAFGQVVGLIPLLVPRDLARREQEHQLSRWAGIAAAAASCALADTRRPESDSALAAVRFLEAGRGVLLTQTLALRTGLEALREREPDLAERFAALRTSLADLDGVPTAEDVSERERAREAGRTLAAEMAEMVEGIQNRHRDLTGLGGAPSRSQLLAQSAAGPIVVVNHSRYGSHAVLIESDNIRSLPLPGLTLQALANRISPLLDATARDALTDSARQQPLHEVLAWLWDTITGPVLDALEPRAGTRIWWVPTGVLAFFPLHAAGYHDTRRDCSPHTVLDRVVSSYAPTLTALAYTRARRRAHPRSGPLVVAMTNTPGQSSLPAAAWEADLIDELYPDTLVLRDASATSNQVQTELGSRAWTHFACHTKVVDDTPSESGLVLHDHRQRSFTVRDIAALEFPDAELAVLASCNTARPPARLTDESVHLATAFLLAGFPQVIGSLWPVNDNVAFDFSSSVYRRLQTTTADCQPAGALATHEATLMLRERYPNLPALWCGQIHLGR